MGIGTFGRNGEERSAVQQCVKTRRGALAVCFEGVGASFEGQQEGVVALLGAVILLEATGAPPGFPCLNDAPLFKSPFPVQTFQDTVIHSMVSAWPKGNTGLKQIARSTRMVSHIKYKLLPTIMFAVFRFKIMPTSPIDTVLPAGQGTTTKPFHSKLDQANNIPPYVMQTPIRGHI